MEQDQEVFCGMNALKHNLKPGTLATALMKAIQFLKGRQALCQLIYGYSRTFVRKNHSRGKYLPKKYTAGNERLILGVILVLLGASLFNFGI